MRKVPEKSARALVVRPGTSQTLARPDALTERCNRCGDSCRGGCTGDRGHITGALFVQISDRQDKTCLHCTTVCICVCIVQLLIGSLDDKGCSALLPGQPVGPPMQAVEFLVNLSVQ